MSKFKLLNDNLNTVLLRLIENKNLCKLIYYDSESPLAEDDIENPRDLLFKRIYPFPIVINNEDEASTYLCVALDDFYRSNSNSGIANNKLVLNILCHNSLWKLKCGLRPFLIMEEVDEMFNNINGIGIGKMQFDRANFIYTPNYAGYRVSYEICNYNGR